MQRTDEYQRARGRAEAKFGFFVHVMVFAAVMGLLLVINLVTSASYLWVIWPLVGWGLALGLHAARVYLLADKDTIIDALTDEEMRH